MDQTLGRDDGISDAGAAFADPAFAPLKARGAPFAILRLPPGDGTPGAGPGGEVLWANAAAAAYWGAGTAAGLAEALLGAGGRGGWLDGLARGLVPGRPPRLARAGLGRGFRMRPRTALMLAWADRDGATLVGLAVPDAEAAAVPDEAAWLGPAWGADEPDLGAPADAPAGDELHGDAPHGDAPHGDAPQGDGLALARRGQLAVLRDRLGRALDGAATLRTLWRTDEAGVVASADAGAFARLGSPLRLDGRALPDAVAPFDPDGAERLRAALAARATFAGVAFDLPVADAAATVPMALGGSPVYGPERRFAGFRGFGTVDLGRLALAERRAPPAQGSDTPSAGPDVLPEAIRAEAPRDERQPAASEAAPAEAPHAAAPPAEAERPANVVHLRAFMDAAFGRSGAPAAPPAAGAVTPPPPEPPAGTDPAAEGGPLSDQLAFLELGEALRARIGATPAAPEASAAEAPSVQVPATRAPSAPPSAPLSAPPSAPPAAEPAVEADLGDPAALLLDRLPAAVLATVGDRLVFANPAAAARLGHADPGALLAGGASAVVSAAEPDRIALRDARGRDATALARRVAVPWAGTTAALWLLAEPDTEAGPRGGAVAPAAERTDDRSVELLDRVDDAVALLDGSGRLRRLNRRGEAWFGTHEAGGADAPRGRSLADLLAPESRAGALALLGEVRDRRDGLGAPPLRREVAALTADGAALPMLLTLGRLGATGFYATLRDLSGAPRAGTGRPEAERAEAGRARAAQDDPARDAVRDTARDTVRDAVRGAGRLRDAGWLPDLLARVSHDIRTPLGAILGFAEVMMDERFGPLGNPRYKDYMRDIHAAGAQVVALVEDLLDLSRIEAGQLDLEVAAVDINRVVTEAVAQMQPEAHRERVIMRTSLAGRVPSALVDERSARQIVKNLLSNAVKFNEPGGQVIVSTAPGDGGGVLLRVRDTGIGMSDEAIAAALEPFGGLPSGAPEGGAAGGRAGGNGLGLPLTRALVGANGASMTIRSRPREGTLVEVSFAAAAEGGARRPA